MGVPVDLSPGDDWPAHYRGFSLQVSPNGNVWWQLYQGTDRLNLEPAPIDIAEALLEVKRIGGRIHVTEDGTVLTRIEDDAADSGYRGVYVGTIEFPEDAELVPPDRPEFSIDLRPDGLSPGDLWPSVYDGSRYSFAGDRVWWHNGQTNKRHPVPDGVPDDIASSLHRFKRQGGSFRVLPWGDVITLVPVEASPGDANTQFRDLPRVVQNIIKLRKERGVEMLPIYVGNMSGTALDVEEPRSLTSQLTDTEREELASWAGSLGETSDRSASNHTSTDTQDTATDSDGEDDDQEPPEFDDDPLEWMHRDLDSTEDRINERHSS